MNLDISQNIEIITSPNSNSSNIQQLNQQRRRRNRARDDVLDNDIIFSFRTNMEGTNNNPSSAIISLANDNNHIHNNGNTESANINDNNDSNNEDMSYDGTIQDIMFNHSMRDIISSILKTQLFCFIFFIFIMLWVKWGLSYYLPLIFLWIIDIYYIITDVIELSTQKKYYFQSKYSKFYYQQAANK